MIMAAPRLAPNCVLFLNTTLPLQSVPKPAKDENYLRLVKGARVSSDIPSAA